MMQNCLVFVIGKDDQQLNKEVIYFSRNKYEKTKIMFNKTAQIKKVKFGNKKV